MPLDYGLFRKAAGDPTPLLGSGKLYSKGPDGNVQLYYEDDAGNVYQLSPAGSGSAPYIVWRPGVPSSGGAVDTWAEVEAFIAAHLGGCTVSVDGTFAVPTIPGSADTECFGRVTFLPFTANIGGVGGSQIVIADGGRIRNPYTLGTLPVNASPTIRSPILMDIPGGQFLLREGGRILHGPGSTVPFIEMTANFSEIACFEGGRLERDPGLPVNLAIVKVSPNIIFLWFRVSQAGDAPFQNSYSPYIFEGDNTNLMIVGYDNTAPLVTQLLYTGGFFELPMSQAKADYFDDSVQSPPVTGSIYVQQVIDWLKARVTGAGTTANRPANAAVALGATYFDTDLGIPIWNNGVNWVNASGVVV